MPDELTGSPPNESEIAAEKSAKESPPSTTQGKKRKDSGRFHATRHAVLSVHPLQALRRLGQDVKQFRRLERRLRETLKPRGEIAEFFFDRFYSSFLRCLLAARLEASAFEPKATGATKPRTLPTLRELEYPTLLIEDEKFQFLLVRAVHAGFEKVRPGLWNAGTESKQLGELTSCIPGGSDSPKLRTASTRSGGT